MFLQLSVSSARAQQPTPTIDWNVFTPEPTACGLGYIGCDNLCTPWHEICTAVPATATWEPLFRTPTPMPTYDLSSCPDTLPADWGTETPSPLWAAQCANCFLTLTPWATSTPNYPTATYLPGTGTPTALPSVTPTGAAPTITPTPFLPAGFGFTGSVTECANVGGTNSFNGLCTVRDSLSVFLGANWNWCTGGYPEIRGRYSFSTGGMQITSIKMCTGLAFPSQNWASGSCSNQDHQAAPDLGGGVPSIGSFDQDHCVVYSTSNGLLNSNWDETVQTITIQGRGCQLGTGNCYVNSVGDYLTITEVNGISVGGAVPTPEPTTAPTPDLSYCGNVNGEPGGVGGFVMPILPVPVVGQATCVVMEPFSINTSLLSWLPGFDVNGVDFPGLRICVSPIMFQNVDILGVSFDLDILAMIMGGIVLIVLIARS